MQHERFAVTILVVLVLVVGWMLYSRLSDGRCRFAGYRHGGLVCTERPPLFLPADAPDIDRI